MSAIAAALISGVFAIGAVVVANSLRKVRRDLDDCLHDRKQLRQMIQLTVSSLVGLLPTTQRQQLLQSIDASLLELDDEAA